MFFPRTNDTIEDKANVTKSTSGSFDSTYYMLLIFVVVFVLCLMLFCDAQQHIMHKNNLSFLCLHIPFISIFSPSPPPPLLHTHAHTHATENKSSKSRPRGGSKAKKGSGMNDDWDDWGDDSSSSPGNKYIHIYII